MQVPFWCPCTGRFGQGWHRDPGMGLFLSESSAATGLCPKPALQCKVTNQCSFLRPRNGAPPSVAAPCTPPATCNFFQYVHQQTVLKDTLMFLPVILVVGVHPEGLQIRQNCTPCICNVRENSAELSRLNASVRNGRD